MFEESGLPLMSAHPHPHAFLLNGPLPSPQISAPHR